MMSHDDTSALVHEIDQIDALLEAFTAGIEQSTVYWHPITEIPPDSLHVEPDKLLYGDGIMVSGYYSHGSQCWRWIDLPHNDFQPTHWCDLPTPPEVTT